MQRRDFLQSLAGMSACLPLAAGARQRRHPNPERAGDDRAMASAAGDPVKLFVAGDVMTGRGIDQVLPHRGDPQLYESYVRNAARYVEIAEARSGRIPRPADFPYIWGDALAALEQAQPDARIVNLETSITTSDAYWRAKGIHYRMAPANIPCLTAAGLDCAVLANNHVLDWGYEGLQETLATLSSVGIQSVGAGTDATAAAAPAIMAGANPAGRILVFAYGFTSSGIPAAWAAGPRSPGVNLLADLSSASIERVAAAVAQSKSAGDTAVASLHWGANWGYAISGARRRFAQRLIEEAGIDVVHGHSAHHPLGIEVHRGKLILYGCGDLLNDYEGIGGHEDFRPDLSLLYFLTLDRATGRLTEARLLPMRIRRFRLERASREDAAWLQDTLEQASAPFGTRLALADGGIVLVPSQS